MVAEGQQLSLELGVRAPANQAQLGEEADNRVGEAEALPPDYDPWLKPHRDPTTVRGNG